MVEKVEVTAQGVVGKGGRGLGLGIQHQPPVPVLLGWGPEGWWNGEGARCCVVLPPPPSDSWACTPGLQSRAAWPLSCAGHSAWTDSAPSSTSAASNPCNQIPLLLLLPDYKFLEGRDYGSCLELHLARVLFLSLSPLPSSFKLLISSLYCSISLFPFVPSFSFLKKELAWRGAGFSTSEFTKVQKRKEFRFLPPLSHPRGKRWASKRTLKRHNGECGKRAQEVSECWVGGWVKGEVVCAPRSVPSLETSICLGREQEEIRRYKTLTG